jgi:UDP-N-acetylmuramate dehydrogenase
MRAWDAMQILENVPLASRTTYRIGGPARYCAQPTTSEEIHQILLFARERLLPVFLLGKGSNLLVSDSGWPGLVIDLTAWNDILWDESGVSCASGALLHTLVRESVERGLCGMAQLAGIPGTIGGGVIMNAGAFEQTLSECLQWVEGIDLTNSTPWRLSREQCGFGYRTSVLQHQPQLILQARFSLPVDGQGTAKAVYSETLRKRKEKQPLDLPNCGSVFKRPAGDYAGRLIQASGLIGLRVGDAMVSPKHANFIVNTGNARAADVRRLIITIQQRVYGEHGVLLEPEVIFVGEFEEPLFRPSAAG